MIIVLVVHLLMLLSKRGYPAILREIKKTDERNVLVKVCNGTETGLYPHPKNCSLYISCGIKGMTKVKQCEAHNHFHPEYKVCVWEQIYPCSGTVSNGMSRLVSFCKKEDEGVYKDPLRCDCYVICSKEGAYHMKCPPHFLFNPATNKCDRKENVRCVARPTTSVLTIVHGKTGEGICKGKKPGNYEDPNSCNGYIACTGLAAVKMKCPQGLWFNESWNKCDLPAKVNCKVATITTSSEKSYGISTDITLKTTNNPISSSGITSEKMNHVMTINHTLTEAAKTPFSCKEMNDGKYAVKDACQYFYLCKDGGKTKLKRCPKHKNFHPVYRSCVWTYLYSCDDPNFCKWKADGKYMNVNNCYGYYQCSGGRTFPRNCDPGWRFNGKRCVDAAQYICPKSQIKVNVVQ